MKGQEEIQGRRLPRVAASRYVDGLFFLGIQDREYVEAISESSGTVVGLGMRGPYHCYGDGFKSKSEGHDSQPRHGRTPPCRTSPF